MKTFEVHLEEILHGVLEIEAESPGQAKRIAIQMIEDDERLGVAVMETSSGIKTLFVKEKES